jgi:hypothetical protein
MRVCTNNALKKIENAGGKTGALPRPWEGGGKKRKATPDDDEEAASSTKKKGRKGKKNAETPADCKSPFNPQ